ncbi:TIGR03088 family PEP-CTERM/XrtA system glycosyltransferase [Methylotuvimicrobium alcaliphilum]|uniref:Sugar transferase, PEP-CTERM/EpsH1 system associated n=1 Tax=Methylotuvimicrobium alcaliphilum (strain DSM 19304 / NCIMB 14124 / VKM B-2133 / 20Z) TaxID=1091494 RepID=G4SYW0_META2|nr:TIGR03088 family PEP-CTERM/XrtA system glycosyltransferase [Methylotuvimicrobium alcaliphilum]CCE24407.1 Sugar transferase, PEP-CTERM/EpsH1 system associated [Methylotuvimicrobium alcaliphilum 20Z]
MKSVESPLIAHVIYKLTTGGLENGLVNLINTIPKNKYRHAIICMTNYTDFKNRILRDDVEIYCLNKKEGKDLKVFFNLYKLFCSIKPDILHTRNLSGLEAQLPGFLAGIKGRVHGEHGRDVDDLDGRHFRYTLLRRFYRLFIQCYIPMSRDLERWLVDHIKVSQKKVSHIYNGVDEKKFHPKKQKRSDLLPNSFQDSELIVIGTVGRQEPVKAPEMLLNSFIEMIKLFPEEKETIRLVFVGTGSLHERLKLIAQQNDVDKLIWFAGDRSDVDQLLQHFDIFVLPSLNEGISNTILEAMASGLPVIATKVGGNTELILDNQTGFLVEKQNIGTMAEKIKFYLDNPEIRMQHGKNARRLCEEKFSLNRMVMDYMSLYDQIIEKYVKN